MGEGFCAICPKATVARESQPNTTELNDALLGMIVRQPILAAAGSESFQIWQEWEVGQALSPAKHLCTISPLSKQHILSAQVNLPIQNSRRTNEHLPLQGIGSQHLKLLAHAHDNHVPILRSQVELIPS